MHLVNWEVVICLKEFGGLGIKQTHVMNLAFMAKIGWTLSVDKDSLWSKVVSRKYILGEIDPSKLKGKAPPTLKLRSVYLP